MGEAKDIIEIKPGLYGISIDVRELFRRWFFKKESDPISLIPKRFFEIFKMHDVSVSQIPRLIHGLTLDQLQTVDTLLPILTPDHLHDTAKLFGIRQEWLEGTSDTIYNTYNCYKNSWEFFRILQEVDVASFNFPVVAFTSVKRLDASSNSDQPIVIVMREKCADLNGHSIQRYFIHNQYLWSYEKSRIQLKAMIRVFYQRYETPVPIFQIDDQTLKELGEGRMFPCSLYRNSTRMKDADLEDYSLSRKESRKSKELDELLMVLHYIRRHNLESAELARFESSKHLSGM